MASNSPSPARVCSLSRGGGRGRRRRSPEGPHGQWGRRGRGEEVIAERTVRESSSYPTLTKTNYSNWSLLMRVILDARGIWGAIEAEEDEEVERRVNKLAKEAICRAVPQETIAAVAVKQTACEAWDVIKIAHVGSERMRKAQATRLRQDFDNIKFCPNEEVSDFAMHLQNLVHKLEFLGDPTSQEVAAKFLRVMPKRYNPFVVAIETSIVIDDLTVEEIMGRAKASEDRLEPVPQEIDGGKLLLTEEQWVARQKEQQAGDEGWSGLLRAIRPDTRRGKQPTWKESGDGGEEERSTSRANDKCRNYGKLGHWARNCRSKEKKAMVHVAKAEEEEPTLLMVHVAEGLPSEVPRQRRQPVHLVEGSMLA